MGQVPMDIMDILKTLPHRYPFLLVDRVIELEPGEHIVALKNVTMNEPQFTGHWPENPVMPGVLMLEAMAQVGGIMVLCTPEDRGKIPVFAGVDGVRWRRLVRPGDQLVIEATMERRRGNMGRAKGVARVDDEVVCEGTFMFVLTDPADMAQE
jgi:3-hydroxyacyl-[acyl-carrier-protein] dehydratase